MPETETTLAIPEINWEEFWEDNPLKPGQHVSVFGPTGTGKSYTLVSLGELFPSHSILIVTKGADDLIGRLVKERGWILAKDVDDIFTGSGKPGRVLRKSWGDRWEKRERPPQRIVFMPEVPVSSVRGRADYLGVQVETLLDRAYEYCRQARGNQLLVEVDETMFAAMELNLQRPFTMFWNEGRSMGLSFAAAMQRPAWIPKSSKSAPTYIVIFDTSEPDDLADLSKVAGFAKSRDMRAALDQLPEHHHLLVVTRGRGQRIFQSRVVIRRMSEDKPRKGK